MSRYAWPANPHRGEAKDDPAGREAYRSRRASRAADVLARELLRAQAEAATTPTPQPRAQPRAVASSDTLLWQPLGPTVLLGGQAEGKPRVTGRVNALCVHPGGQRAYAAAANGGVWYTGDGGQRWRSIAGLASTTVTGIKRPAHRNVTAALHVIWRDPAGSETVFMGTGEPHIDRKGRPHDAEDGLGIFVTDQPLSAVDDPWRREAPALVNEIVLGFASSPDGSTVVAATTKGLLQRPPAPVAANAEWAPVPGLPALVASERCTSVLWTQGDPTSVTPANQRRPERLWVWIEGSTNNGLWVRDGAGPGFVRVTVATAGAAFARDRAVLAALPLPGLVWLLQDLGGGQTGLFRVTNTKAVEGAPTARRVTGVPDIFHGTGWYNLALAVDPSNENRVAVAGNYLGVPGTAADAHLLTTRDGATLSYDASILVDAVVPDAATAGEFAYGTSVPAAKLIGVGVHPDVHALAFSNNGASLWTGCDGGLYRNDRVGTSAAGFYARNDGLSISEVNFLGASPVHEGDLLGGLQDNGIGSRLSGSVWQVTIVADGGGIVREHHRPDRWFGQYIQGEWSTSAGYNTGGPLRAADRSNPAEKSSSAFYTQPGAIAHTRGGAPTAQFLIGTNRVWYTDDYGTSWATLPAGTDAFVAAPAPPTWNQAQDNLGSPVHSCRWQSADIAWVLTDNAIYRLSRTAGSHEAGGAGTWAKPITKVLDKNAPASTDEGKEKKRTPPDPTQPLALLRSSPTWTEIEPNFIPAQGATPAREALYLGTLGQPVSTLPAVDTLWWYDGTNWMTTELATRGNNGTALPAPVTSILVDPEHRDEVWVGTTVGVVHGVRTAVASPPAGGRTFNWNWTMHLNGLPEAPIEDLGLFDGRFTDSGGTAQPGPKLLRAAIGARGVWELRLDNTVVPALTYLRVHDGDMRHRASARLVQADATTERPWHASPDIRPRLAPAAITVTAPTNAVPWVRVAAAPAIAPPAEMLRRFQAALRSSTNDPRIVAHGRWDAVFSEILRDHGAPTIAGPAPATPNHLPQQLVRIDGTFFGAHFTPANRNAEPWTGRPSFADLLERTPVVPEGGPGEAALTLPAKAWKVDIVVHHRGRVPRAGGDVRVTLLWFVDPASKNRMAFNEPARWAAIPGNWCAQVQAMLNSNNGVGAALPAGWSYALGTASTSRYLTLDASQTLDPLEPGVATVDLNLTGLKKDRLVLLVAVVRAGGDVALANVALRQLVLENPAVGVRAVRIA